MASATQLRNFVGGHWQDAAGAELLGVSNPATAETIAQVPLSSTAHVDAAVTEGLKAFADWRETPVGERIQPLFRLKALLEENVDGLARIITTECGKTYGESVGEIRRGIENVEVACGAPVLMQGVNNEDIARGIDEHMFRQPLGVVAAITPFNFPCMIPLWFLPYAVATGNSFLLKPSEQVPLTAARIVELCDEAGFPAGVVQMIHGDRNVVETIIDHPDVRAISFVGSTPVAKAVYARATLHGKRAQCQGGAKNPAVILPDANVDIASEILADSAFGCAGQRCLATSVAITVGEATPTFTEAICDHASSRRVGFGLDDEIQMGPVISHNSRTRIEGIIEDARSEGVGIKVDGRQQTIANFEDGSFVKPTVLSNVPVDGGVSGTEIFGPVLSLMHADSVNEAIAMVNNRRFGNQACLFTSSGVAAREFRTRVRAGNVGINVGVAAPIAFFPFSGWDDSFFGDLHAQGRHGVEFYTETKVVVERWPDNWSRKF
ncbi:MAG: methylmalonate-semialdehyde dehydrogenase (CoA acylating) [Planctomycetaceae bacterium]|nr:methylmalonate-semialdehyde dehydrogenase (CoA acylating) [Planctomycetaceae bacterium]